MTDDEFLQAGKLVYDLQEIFYQNVLPHLLGIEETAAAARDENLSNLVKSMRNAFDADAFEDLPSVVSLKCL